MQTFPLFGKEVTIPSELANFNVFRDKYENMTEKVFNEFTAQYKNKFNNVQQILEGYLHISSVHLTSMIDIAVNDLIANKIFDVDRDAFIKAFLAAHNGTLRVHKALGELESKYEEILDDQNEKDAYRKARRQNRGKWIGGGFGMEGAIKGAVQAGAFNAVSGIAHGAANVVGSAFSAIDASMKKSALFKDPDTFDDLLTAVVYDCQDVLFTLVDILKKNGTKIIAITKDDENRADI